jgi:protoheme IX farnesyltransferase
VVNINKHINIISQLGKFKITFFVAISSSVGYILYKESIDILMILPVLGIFLLASGSSGFNHLQERKYDLLMDRTKGRPIPSGEITETYAYSFAILFSLIGMSLLYFYGNLISAILGLTALIWYNLVYTPLKMKSALAVVPGSVIGALPPVIGWTSAGGEVTDPKILSFALFFFIWQIPHFWLLLLMYNKDYEKAGFPTLTKIFNNVQLSRITYVWISGLVASCLLLPLFGVVNNYIAILGLFISGIWLLWKSKSILSEYFERIAIRNAFMNINLFVLAVVFIISIEKLFLTEL